MQKYETLNHECKLVCLLMSRESDVDCEDLIKAKEQPQTLVNQAAQPTLRVVHVTFCSSHWMTAHITSEHVFSVGSHICSQRNCLQVARMHKS